MLNEFLHLFYQIKKITTNRKHFQVAYHVSFRHKFVGCMIFWHSFKNIRLAYPFFKFLPIIEIERFILSFVSRTRLQGTRMWSRFEVRNSRRNFRDSLPQFNVYRQQADPLIIFKTFTGTRHRSAEPLFQGHSRPGLPMWSRPPNYRAVAIE